MYVLHAHNRLFLFCIRNKVNYIPLIRGHSSKTREKIARTCRILWVDCTIFSVLHALRSFARFHRTLCLQAVRLFFESIQILKKNLVLLTRFFLANSYQSLHLVIDGMNEDLVHLYDEAKLSLKLFWCDRGLHTIICC